MGSVRMVSLDKINLNEEYQIININSDSFMLRRFLDIGIIEGAIIKKVLISPFKGICAYYIMSSTIAIRDKDAKEIMVSYA